MEIFAAVIAGLVSGIAGGFGGAALFEYYMQHKEDR